MTDTKPERIAVGDCPNCGYVTADDVRLPSCTCGRCNDALDRATTAPREEVEQRA